VIATSISSWLLDDNSSFVFIFYENHTYARRLRGELICHVDRPQRNTVRVFSYQGGVWQNHARGLKRSSIIASIEKALAIKNRHILIRGLDTRGEKIVAAVEVAPARAGDIVQDPEFTAVCVSGDDGRSFDEKRRFIFENDGEVQDVAWIM
jgi:hypothetical protein